MKILVGLSGGVDSASTALILKNQGHEVIGVTMAIWGKNGVYKKIQEKITNFSKTFVVIKSRTECMLKKFHGVCTIFK